MECSVTKCKYRYDILSREHYKLPQWGPGQSPSRKRILVHFELGNRIWQQLFRLFLFKLKKLKWCTVLWWILKYGMLILSVCLVTAKGTGPHRARVDAVKFVGIAIWKIWHSFGLSIRWPGDLDLWPWNWCTLLLAGWATFLAILVFLRPFVLNL